MPFSQPFCIFFTYMWMKMVLKEVYVIYTSAMNEFCCQTNRFLHYMSKYKVSMLEDVNIDSMLEDEQ